MSVPATPTTSRLARPVSFTPRRKLSSASSSTSTSDLSRGNPSIPGSTKKFKAAVSSESKTRINTAPNGRPKSALLSSPKKSTFDRPKTPSTPRRDASPMDSPMISEMDVSRIDPEEALVDFETVDAGDISTEMVEDILQDYGSEDKVLVSIRFA